MGKTEIGIKVIKPKTPPPPASSHPRQPAGACAEATPEQSSQASRQGAHRAAAHCRAEAPLPKAAGQRPHSPRPHGIPLGKTGTSTLPEAPLTSRAVSAHNPR